MDVIFPKRILIHYTQSLSKNKLRYFCNPQEEPQNIYSFSFTFLKAVQSFSNPSPAMCYSKVKSSNTKNYSSLYSRLCIRSTYLIGLVSPENPTPLHRDLNPCELRNNPTLFVVLISSIGGFYREMQRRKPLFHETFF